MSITPHDKPGSRLRVNSLEDVGIIDTLIHDEFFEPADIQHDAVQKRVIVPFRRIFHGGPTTVVEKTALSIVEQVAVLRCLLVIDLAEGVDIPALSTPCALANCAYDSDRKVVRLGCWLGEEIVVRVSQLALTYEALEFRGKARIQRSTEGLVETTDAKVYD